ncbi:type III-B CRISPR module-associated protein Cmr5 [Sulfolobus sp. E5-1-F]|uniref:type III-B CRISPR module-associated protein Cmr5 n=1 Tax=Saccharolobus sp. E5-1-F TaxID=2663019 RepID=UPI0012971FC0|nr:type III-B CRISPR module-associated protein Cmr5 [Sulfolobus sp. E5-1-F]QGA53949.1 type III-B CRISPR module-associated protein Cmr5 [Sulfolobus sp. E5-1-F]
MEKILDSVLNDFNALSKEVKDKAELRKKIRARVRELPSLISSFGIRTVLYFYYSKVGNKEQLSDDEKAYYEVMKILIKYVKEALIHLGVNVSSDDIKEILNNLSNVENEAKVQYYIDLPLQYLKRLIEAEFEG